jgi:hypothetical protein
MGEGAGVRRTAVGVATAVVLVTAALAVGVPAASAEALSPWWGVSTGSEPTNLVSGEPGEIVVTAENRGDASTSGEVTIVDRLPAGLTASGIEAVARDGSSGPVSCTLASLTCTYSEALLPYEEIEVKISVSVQGAVSGEENIASVFGGGGLASRTISASHAIEVEGSERFGIED